MKKTTKNLLLILVIGLFLRICIMPFAMSADLLSMYYRSNAMEEYDLWGLKTNQDMAHFIYAYWIKINGSTKINNLYPKPFGQSPYSYTSSVGNWLVFINHPKINQVLFLFKIPHLLADLLVFYILATILEKDKKRNLVLTFWWLNPVNIYAFYIFSRHDSITLLALTISFLFFFKRKLFPALLSFFAAIQIRFQPLLYAPIYLIHTWKNSISTKSFFKTLFLIVTAVSLYFFAIKQLPFNLDLERELQELPVGYEKLTATSETSFINKIVELPIKIATSVGGSTTTTKLLIFSIFYLAFNVFYLFVKKTSDPQKSFLQLNLILYISMAAYFIINDFSPHYFVWLSLFASVGALLQKEFIYGYLLGVVGWGIMGLVDPGNFAINQNLFLPVSSVIFNTPQLAYIIPHQYLISKFGYLVFSSGLIWSSYLAYKYLAKDLDYKNVFKKGLKVALMLLAFLPLVFAKPVQAAKVPTLTQETTDKVLLEKGIPYENSFVANNDSFGVLDLKFDTSRSTQHKQIEFRLKEKGATDWYYQNPYDAADFYNNAFYPFGFPVINNANGKEFIYQVELLDDSDYPLYIYDNTYVVSKEGSMREILTIIGSDLQSKWTAQKGFFEFWLLILGINFGIFLTIIFWPRK